MNKVHSSSKVSRFFCRFGFLLPRMVKLTFPLTIPIVLKSKGIITLLIVLSILLGVVPTLKSDLEAGILNQANIIISNGSPTNIPNILNIRLQYFNQIPSNNSDFVESVSFSIFHNIALGGAFLLYLLIIVIAFGINFWSTVARTKITARIFAVLRGEAFQKGLVTDPSDLPSVSNVAGQYTMGIHQGADNVSRTYGNVLDIGQHIFSLITTIFIVATRSKLFAFGCLIVVILQATLSLIQARRLKKKRETLDEKRNDLVGRTDNIFEKREIILAYEQQEKYEEKLGTLTKNYAEVGQNLDIQEQKYSGFSEVINDLGRISIIVISLVLVLLNAQTTANIGDIYFLVSIYVRILFSVSNILYMYDDMKRSEATSKTFLELLQVRGTINIPTQQNQSAMDPLSQLTASYEQNLSIRFVDVSFKYQDEASTVLRNCNFYAPANAATLFVGRSGCGKTTIARIILGFWPVHEGQVYIGGKALNAWDLTELRKRMSYVAQGDHIIDDSVRDNLSWAYTSSKISDDRMLETLAEVGIIKNLQEHSILEQPARNLSGGQQQRLSIARMLLDESPIVILDEPLTGVDVFTLHELFPVLDKALKRPNRTVLMFSHNLVLTSFADYIVVLGDGLVDEEGEAKQLLAKQGGIFATLYQTALDDLKGKS